MRAFSLTIITPTFNCAGTIGETLASVERFESLFPGAVQHLIGDAGSTDGTVDMLDDYRANHAWVHFHILRGMNIPATLNRLLESAVHEWVLVLNGDDAVLPEQFAQMARYATNSEEVDVLCGDVTVLSPAGSSLGSRGCRVERIDDFMSVNHPAMLARRTLFDRVGRFRESTPTAYDYVWTWSAHRTGAKFGQVPLTVAQARLGGISQKRAHRAAREILLFKFHSGAWYSATKNYVGFVSKSLVKAVFPARLTHRAIRIYRGLTRSVDQY